MSPALGPRGGQSIFNTNPVPPGFTFNTGGVSGGTAAQVNDALRLTPFYLGSPMDIINIMINVVQAGDSGCLLIPAIYASDATSTQPTVLLSDSALTLPADAVASPSVPTSLFLEPGFYWAGGLTVNAPTTPPVLSVSNAPWGIYPYGTLPYSGPWPSPVRNNGVGASNITALPNPYVGIGNIASSPLLFLGT